MLSQALRFTIILMEKPSTDYWYLPLEQVAALPAQQLPVAIKSLYSAIESTEESEEGQYQYRVILALEAKLKKHLTSVRVFRDRGVILTLSDLGGTIRPDNLVSITDGELTCWATRSDRPGSTRHSINLCHADCRVEVLTDEQVAACKNTAVNTMGAAFQSRVEKI